MACSPMPTPTGSTSPPRWSTGRQVYVPGGGRGRARRDRRPVVPAASAGPIDLNIADAAALETLPGVGPSTAAAIIDHRERNGPFVSVDGLLDVRGIGEAKLAQIRDLVRV